MCAEVLVLAPEELLTVQGQAYRGTSSSCGTWTVMSAGYTSSTVLMSYRAGRNNVGGREHRVEVCAGGEQPTHRR